MRPARLDPHPQKLHRGIRLAHPRLATIQGDRRRYIFPSPTEALTARQPARWHAAVTLNKQGVRRLKDIAQVLNVIAALGPVCGTLQRDVRLHRRSGGPDFIGMTTWAVCCVYSSERGASHPYAAGMPGDGGIWGSPETYCQCDWEVTQPCICPGVKPSTRLNCRVR